MSLFASLRPPLGGRTRLIIIIIITLCLKNVPSLTGYSFNIHSPIFKNNFWHVQKSATRLTFSKTSLLLTLFCSEVKIRPQRQGSRSMKSTTEGEGALFEHLL